MNFLKVSSISALFAVLFLAFQSSFLSDLYSGQSSQDPSPSLSLSLSEMPPRSLLPSPPKALPEKLHTITPDRARQLEIIGNLTSNEWGLTHRKYWDGIPIVIRKWKLLFFPVSKVGVANWKQLLRRMTGLRDWRKENVLDPKYMGVVNFNEIPLDEAKEILASDEWTRAVFLREPTDRFFSAYADKVYRNKDGERRPGNRKYNELGYAPFDKFLERCMHSDPNKDKYARICRDDQHFIPQAALLPSIKKWGFVINFWGRFEHMQEDAKALFDRLGPPTWRKYGASGWGKHRNNSLFAEQQNPKHASSSEMIAAKYRHLIPRIREQQAMDYRAFVGKYGWAEWEEWGEWPEWGEGSAYDTFYASGAFDTPNK